MRFIISPKTQDLICARTGWVGQAHTDLLALNANRFIELPQTRTKPQSEHKQHQADIVSERERPMRGGCEV